MKYLSNLNKKELNGKTSLLRVDLNIKSLKDHFRIDSVLPTIKYLLKNSSKVVILSHRGRPNSIDPKLSLRPIAKIISQKLKSKIKFIDSFADFNFSTRGGSAFGWKKIKKEIDSEKKVKVFVLENLRFLSGEEKNSNNLAKKLASLGDLYINDAFAVSHRKNASVFAITKHIKSYAGLLMEKEIAGLTKATKNPKQPLIVVLGGTKIDTKINIVKNLNSRTKFFLLGSSIFNEIKNPIVKNIIKNKKCLIPIDFFKRNGKFFDIGPETIVLYKKIISEANTIIWNGPVGMFEDKKYSKGTAKIASAIIRSKAFKVIGGGETANFILNNKMNKNIDLLSTGGGAMLDFLAGKKLPGIEALK
ncbi:MAG: phosphoglycerate kinase [bacterium]|nr:phosphoglycerate kinase [bacterium]